MRYSNISSHSDASLPVSADCLVPAWGVFSLLSCLSALGDDTSLSLLKAGLCHSHIGYSCVAFLGVKVYPAQRWQRQTQESFPKFSMVSACVYLAYLEECGLQQLPQGQVPATEGQLSHQRVAPPPAFVCCLYSLGEDLWAPTF